MLRQLAPQPRGRLCPSKQFLSCARLVTWTGISPPRDNLVCDGEVFVRTYLVGRQGVIEALQATTPLRAELASVGNQPEYPIELPVSTSLASVSSPALIRVTRPMGEPTTAEKTQPQGQVAIRLYVSNANGTEVPVQVTMPVLTNASTPAAN